MPDFSKAQDIHNRRVEIALAVEYSVVIIRIISGVFVVCLGPTSSPAWFYPIVAGRGSTICRQSGTEIDIWSNCSPIKCGSDPVRANTGRSGSTQFMCLVVRRL